jgi:lipopolysaccharide biosynthesis regulator YciM
MTKEDLLGRELSNLYAIAKQVNHYFNDSDISFLSEEAQQLLMRYVEFSCTNEEQTSENLRALGVNPGNTSDSIVNEITENLHGIATEKGLNKKVRESSYMVSLNRLIGYHSANIENIGYLLEE